MPTTVLWGVPKGEPKWAEAVITEAATADDPKLAKARAWAEAQGFTGLRQATLDDSPPDFVGALNIKRRSRK